MKKSIFSLLIVALSVAAHAQFTEQGFIEYERKTNIQRQMEDNEWFKRMKDQMPKFITTYHNYYFDTKHSYYLPGKETDEPKNPMFANSPGANNKIYSDFYSNQVIALKQVFEQQYLIKDSLRKSEWKIGTEIREVAGYKCRKAVTKICDSVYVVAFYTDEIPVSGGPEMFGGLPGMILELAIPRLYCTWVAQKVDKITTKPENFVIPNQGKETTQKDLNEKIISNMKGWGSMAQRSVWWVTL